MVYVIVYLYVCILTDQQNQTKLQRNFIIFVVAVVVVVMVIAVVVEAVIVID